MVSLTTADQQSFFPIYSSLPLVKFNFPLPYVLLFTIIVTILFIIEQNRNLPDLTKEMSARMLAPQFIATSKYSNRIPVSLDRGSSSMVLAFKDFLNLMRSPVELSYGLFLALLMFGFFWLLSRVSITGYSLKEWVSYLIVFGYSGLLFFANTYLLRLVYPLFAKEGIGSWYLFSLPLKVRQIIKSKIIYSLILCFPLLIAAVSVWYLLPFVVNHQLLLAFSTVEIIIFNCLFQLFSGAIWPNFADGDNPERVSTSSMGLLTLAATSVVIILSAWGIHSLIMDKFLSVNFVLAQSTLILLVIFTLYKLAEKTVGKYQF